MSNLTVLAAAQEVEITPPVGIKLEGYIDRKENSRGIHDPLMAAVLIIQQGDQTVVLISLDLLLINASVVKKIREAISSETRIPGSNILVTCTHTHSGPAGILQDNPLFNTEKDVCLEDILVRKITGAASWAFTSLKPAVMRVGYDLLNELGKNRNSPDKTLDSQVMVMVVEDLQGNVMAVWANYGCHPTVLGPSNLYISADFPGAARQVLRGIYPRMTWLFANGASGDISTRFTRRGQGFDEVRRFGYLLAGSVLRAVQLAEPLSIDGIQSLVEPVTIPLREFPSAETAEIELKNIQESWEKLQQSNAPASELRIAKTKLEGAQAQLLMSHGYRDRKSVESEIQFIQLGDFAIISIPGEPFTQTVLDIKKRSPFSLTSIVSYGNDYLGYFPDEESIRAGTYEALVSPFKTGAAEIIKDLSIKLLMKGLTHGS